MKSFLPEATDFTDIPIQDPPDWLEKKFTALCPKCKGHGLWNLRLNQYKSHIPQDRHFRQSCSNCNGWGWVDKHSRDAICLHEYKHTGSYYTHDHEYTCQKCGKQIRVDSSG